MAFVTDTFTDTAGTALQSHTGETGATWTRYAAYSTDMVVANNRIRSNSTGTGYYASGVPTTNEYDVEVDVYVASVTNSIVGVMARAATAGTDWYLARYNGNGGANTWELYKQTAAGATTLLGSYAQTLTVGNTYRLKLQVRDATKKVFVDGVERISSTNNDFTIVGRAGIRGNLVVSDSTGYHLDNFSATDAGGTSGTLSADVATATAASPSSTLTAGATFSAQAATASGAAPTAALSGGASLSAGVAAASGTSPDAAVSAGATFSSAAAAASAASLNAAVSAGAALSGAPATAAATSPDAGILAGTFLLAAVTTATAASGAAAFSASAVFTSSVARATATSPSATLSAPSVTPLDMSVGFGARATVTRASVPSARLALSTVPSATLSRSSVPVATVTS